MLDKVIKITALKRIIYNDQNTIRINKKYRIIRNLFDINQTKIYTAINLIKNISHYNNSKDEDEKKIKIIILKCF